MACPPPRECLTQPQGCHRAIRADPCSYVSPTFSRQQPAVIPGIRRQPFLPVTYAASQGANSTGTVFWKNNNFWLNNSSGSLTLTASGGTK